MQIPERQLIGFTPNVHIAKTFDHCASSQPQFLALTLNRRYMAFLRSVKFSIYLKFSYWSANDNDYFNS